jgi:hypothetical protein
MCVILLVLVVFGTSSSSLSVQTTDGRDCIFSEIQDFIFIFKQIILSLTKTKGTEKVTEIRSGNVNYHRIIQRGGLFVLVLQNLQVLIQELLQV